MSCPVSVVIPCYRCGSTIERAIKSIAQQYRLPEEVLLIDDCSDDEGETINILYRLKQQYELSLKIVVILCEKTVVRLVLEMRVGTPPLNLT